MQKSLASWAIKTRVASSPGGTIDQFQALKLLPPPPQVTSEAIERNGPVALVDERTVEDARQGAEETG